MNLAQHIANPASGASLLRLYDTPQPCHLHPANTALQTVRRVREKILPEDELPVSADRQFEVMELVREKGYITYADAASALGLGMNSTQNLIRRMVTLNRLVRVKNEVNSPWRFELPGKT